MLASGLLFTAACVRAVPNPAQLTERGLFARDNAIQPVSLVSPSTTAGRVNGSGISYEPDFPTPLLSGEFSHVIFLSVDGLHQSDLAYYVDKNPSSAFATLVNGGVECACQRRGCAY